MSDFEDYRGPIITVDNALGQYVNDLRLDTDVIQEFYDGLDFDGKKPLSECNIHISALACVNDPGIEVGGVHIRNKNEANLHHYDPQTPKSTDILILIGSVISSNKSPAQVLGHELVHHASSQNYAPRVPRDEERSLRFEHMYLTDPKVRTLRFIGRSAVWGSLMYVSLESMNAAGIGSDPNITTAAIAGVSLEIINGLVYRKRRQDYLMDRLGDISSKLISYYNASEWEELAITLGNLPSTGLEIELKDDLPAILYRDVNKKNRMIDHLHRGISLGRYSSH